MNQTTELTKPVNLYVCPGCMQIVKRTSDKKSMKSHCLELNKEFMIQRIDNPDDVIVKMRKRFLKGRFDLTSFDTDHRAFLESAFEQGATVMFNAVKEILEHGK